MNIAIIKLFRNIFYGTQRVLNPLTFCKIWKKEMPGRKETIPVYVAIFTILFHFQGEKNEIK